MLVLRRAEGESIQLGSEITITILRVSGKRVKLGINAPRQLLVTRPKPQQNGPVVSARPKKELP